MYHGRLNTIVRKICIEDANIGLCEYRVKYVCTCMQTPAQS